jgi:hypothetical protein
MLNILKDKELRLKDEEINKEKNLQAKHDEGKGREKKLETENNAHDLLHSRRVYRSLHHR